MWLEIFLTLVILALLGWIFFSGGEARLDRLNRLQREVRALRGVNETLRGGLESARGERSRLSADICSTVRDLELAKAAISGSRACREELLGRYGLEPGPGLVDRILGARYRLNEDTKRALECEVLVGETGETILKNLASGIKIDRTAAEAEAPVSLVRSQIKMLQILGYIDEQLRPTDRTRALALV